MKKLSNKAWEYSKTLTRTRFERRQSEVAKRRARRRALHVETAECFNLEAPAVFSAFNTAERRALLRFLTALRRRIVDVRKPVRIDFRRTQKMISCGAVLFIAELDRCLRLTRGSVKVSYCAPKDRIVAQVIQQVGISSLLGRPQRLRDDFDKTVRHWRYATGVHADATDFDRVLESYEGRMAAALSKSIFKGVTEAMTNCAHHAYVAPRIDGCPAWREKRWWMLSQEVDGELSVAFCDLGMGIPRSLPSRLPNVSRDWFDRLAGFLANHVGRPQESAMVKAAIEIGCTRTNAEHRGLGLIQIVETARQLPGSSVLILSNAGGYLLQPDRRTEEVLLKYNDSILGTLIQWKMPIAVGEIHDGNNREN